MESVVGLTKEEFMRELSQKILQFTLKNKIRKIKTFIFPHDQNPLEAGLRGGEDCCFLA